MLARLETFATITFHPNAAAFLYGLRELMGQIARGGINPPGPRFSVKRLSQPFGTDGSMVQWIRGPTEPGDSCPSDHWTVGNKVQGRYSPHRTRV
jgi:hypothetical protein